MIRRIDVTSVLSDVMQQLRDVRTAVDKKGEQAGLSPLLLELVKIRASQINGCAFCIDLHVRDTKRLGEDERRILLLPAWHETEWYTAQERAALELTEVISRLSEHQDVPDEVYDRATAVLNDDQYAVVVWAIGVINAFNRLAVTSRKPLPRLAGAARS